MSFYIVGAGGFGRETLDVLLTLDEPVTAFLDEGLAATTVRGLPVRRPSEAAAGAAFVVGIADPRVRRRLADELTAAGLRPHAVVSPRAVVGPETTVAPGCVILAQAHVSSSVRLEHHVQINYNATIGHDAVLQPYATVYPGANISGAAILEEGATVGSNACVLQGRRVGRGAFVGAGAVVTHDVPPASVVVGVPARLRQDAHPDAAPPEA